MSVWPHLRAIALVLPRYCRELTSSSGAPLTKRNKSLAMTRNARTGEKALVRAQSADYSLSTSARSRKAATSARASAASVKPATPVQPVSAQNQPPAEPITLEPM